MVDLSVKVAHTGLQSVYLYIFFSVTTMPIKIINEPVHELSNNVVYATSKASDQPALTLSLIRAFTCR